MKKLEVLNIEKKDLENMRVIKKMDCSPKPKIWVSSDNVMYKKDIFQIIRRFSDYIEIFKDYQELSKCVFPDKLFYVDGKYIGYTMPYYNDYKAINFRMHKKNYKLKEKQQIMKNIVKVISDMHEYDFLHGDLKCSNVIHKDDDIKVIDFEKIKIKECEDPAIYKMILKEEINQLNLVLLSVLFERDMSFVLEEEYMEFIEEIDFCKEFKDYLINCIKYNENKVSYELYNYIKSITKKNIVEGKELVKSLQL